MERPSFSSLVNSITGFAEITAGYLDVSNYNPFEANVSTATASEEKCDDTAENEHDEHDTDIGVEVDDCPIIANVHCSSEDGSPCDDSLL